jgi:aminoglycoside 3-N-acetyltransferase
VLETSASPLRELWRALGIGPGQVILCHSFLPSLGRLVPGPEVVVDTLLEAIGPDGTLVAPTFTYSYFRGEVYDVQQSPSRVGLLGDVVRSRPEAVRSRDPNFSMAAIGAAAGPLMRRASAHSFGPGSPYDQLMQADVRALLLGVDYTALPLFMHLEKLHGVAYRYDKPFSGTTRDQGREVADMTIHFVRDMEQGTTTDRTRIGPLIDAQPECVRRTFGYGEHRLVPGAVVARVVSEQLARDPHCLLKEPAGAAA